jgi:thiamine-phosphate diphosphorylase
MEIENIKTALKIIQKTEEFSDFIPEVGSNIVMAKVNANDIKDVAGIPGRISKVYGKPKAFMKPNFGASSHMARLILTIMQHDPSKRSAMNLKFHEKTIEICEKLGLKVSYYDRTIEPKPIKRMEGGSIPWGVEKAIEKIGSVPDVIYHLGDWGKEPSISIIGKDAVEVAKMVRCIAKLFHIREGYKVLFAPSRGSYTLKKPKFSCIFCGIAENDPNIPAKVLYKDSENMIIMNIFPYNRGHLEVVPLKHLTDFNELNRLELSNIFELLQKTLKLMREVIKPDGINIGINLGEVAGASVKHLHIHLVPRFKMESGFMETVANTRVIEENLDETYEKYMKKIEILRD